MTTPDHPPSQNLGALDISPRIRNLLHECAGMFGMTAGRMRDCQFLTSGQVFYVQVPQLNDHTGYGQGPMNNDTHVRWVHKQAQHRMPSRTTFDHAITTMTRRDRLHRDPLAAIEIVRLRKPDAFI